MPDNLLLTQERDSMLIKDIGIQSGDRLRVRSSYRMTIFLKILVPNPDRQSEQESNYISDPLVMEFVVRAEDEVGELKRMVADREGIPVNQSA